MPMLTHSIIAKESAMMLGNKTVVANLVNRGYEEEYNKSVNGYKIGDTVNVKKPARYLTIDGPAIGSFQVSDETSIPLRVNRNKIVPLEFTNADMALNIEEFRERFLDNAINQLAHDIDSDILSLYDRVPNFVGTPGQTPNGFDVFAQASARMTLESAPTSDRNLMIDPLTEASVAGQIKSLGLNISEEAFKKGMVGRIAGAETYMTAQAKVHQVGVLGGTPTVNGAAQTGLTLNITGAPVSTANYLRRGDIITIANHFGVNPLSRQPQPYQRTYCVAENVTTNGSGQAAVLLTTPITPTGAAQSVVASPANAAAITVLTGSAGGFFTQNLMFHKNAFAFVSVPLPTVSAPVCEQVRYKGISLRMTKNFDLNSGKELIRLECLYGYKEIYPELATRITA